MERLEETKKALKNFLNFLPQMLIRSTIVALAGNGFGLGEVAEPDAK